MVRNLKFEFWAFFAIQSPSFFQSAFVFVHRFYVLYMVYTILYTVDTYCRKGNRNWIVGWLIITPIPFKTIISALNY